MTMINRGIERKREPEIPVVALETITTGSNSFRVVCFPHAGGNASWFHAWSKAAKYLGITLQAIKYPGHAGLLNCDYVQSIESLAVLVDNELSSYAENTILFGHSMGSLVAFEAAHQAAQRGIRYRGIHLSASLPPSIPRKQKRSQLSDKDLIKEVGMLDPDSPNALECDEIAGLFLPIVRNDFFITERYKSFENLGLQDIDIYCGTEDAEFNARDADLWKRHTKGSVRVHEFPGGHFYLRSQGDRILQTLGKTS